MRQIQFSIAQVHTVYNEFIIYFPIIKPAAGSAGAHGAVPLAAAGDWNYESRQGCSCHTRIYL